MELNGSSIVNGKQLIVKKNYPFRIAWINDIHVGSQYGIFPKKYIANSGNVVLPNKGQSVLLKYWSEFAEQCKINKVNILSMVGDLVTGQNPKEAGKYVLMIELKEQVACAAKLINDFCEDVGTIEEIWIWKGTPYHDSRDSSLEEQVVDKLISEYNLNVKFFNEYKIINLEYKNNTKTLFVTHPASGGVVYPETAMGRDMLFWQEGVADGKLPKVDMIVRAHKHEFIEVHKASIRALQLPCWQFFVPYDGAMKNFARYQPDIGGVIMLFDDMLRTTVWHFIYPNVIEPQRFLNIQLDKGVAEACLSKK